jgi:hypothetical protein
MPKSFNRLIINKIIIFVLTVSIILGQFFLCFLLGNNYCDVLI